MPNVARVGDQGFGVCPCHLVPTPYITTFTTGASTVKTNGRTTTNVGTVGVATCGHPTIAITASPNVVAEGSNVHRLGDMGMNCGAYTVISASPNVVAN